MKKFAIVTPTYNEVRNIKTLLSRLDNVCGKLPNTSFELFVVDDSSPDGTAKAARQAAKKIKSKNVSVRVLERKEKDGLGRAYVYAFRKILDEQFDYIIQIDADLSHDPKYIEGFVEEAERGRDFVVASRYIKGGGIRNWNLRRKLLSRGGNIYTRMILGNKITDYTGGFNLFSTKLLKRIKLDSLESGGYGFFIELKYFALKQSKNYGQIPIIFTDRQHGQSKLPKNTLAVNLLLVPWLKLSSKNN